MQVLDIEEFLPRSSLRGLLVATCGPRIRRLSLPFLDQELSGQAYISTADGDKGSMANPALSFEVTRPSYIYILRDARGTSGSGGKVGFLAHLLA